MSMYDLLVKGRVSGLVILIVISIFTWVYVRRARANKIEPIRKLPAIRAMEEAAGRAVEMNRPLMVTYGMASGIGSDTLAGLFSVRYLAKLAAQKRGRLLIGVGGERTLPIARENYRLGCVEGGAPELFNELNIRFYTSQQWAYASGVMGLMQTEKPAACVFMGSFLVEGIHFGITSRRINTVSIGGNSGLNMAAFMFVTMDYVLFGEELYAAGAYFSENAVNSNTLAAGDLFKWVFASATLFGGLLYAAGSKILVTLLGM